MQEQAPNRRELRRSRAGVVSVTGKGAALIASGTGRQDERNRTADEVSKDKGDVETGKLSLARDEPRGNLLTAAAASGMKAA